MDNRRSKAVFVVGGTPEELVRLEKALKEQDIEGVMPNEASRLLGLKFIVVYADYKEGHKEDCNFSYVYRTTNCSDTSKPRELKLNTALRRLRNNYFFTGKKLRV